MNAQQLKNSILQEAIEGRLVPQDPNDEPASVLLDRIRKEKAQLVKEGKLKKKDLVETPISEEEIPFEIPENWEWVRIKTILNVHSAHRVHEKDWRTSGIPFYRAREIGKLSDDGYVNNDLFIERKLYDEFSKSGVPQPGDLMVTAVGTLGKTYIVKEGDLFYYKDGSVLCFNNFSGMDATFLKFYIESPAFIEQYANESQGTTVATLTMVRVNSYLIPLPPLAEQKRIVEKIEELLPKVEEYGKAQEALDKLSAELPERLKKSILQEAIEGRLVPQDPNDEPASVLLERIRKEKARLVKEGKLKKKDLVETPISEEEIPFEIPKNWEWVRLGIISTYAHTKKKINAAKADPNLWGLDLEDIEKGGRLLCVRTVGERNAIGDKTFFSGGDILYSKLRPYLLKILIAPKDGICTPEIVPFTCYGGIQRDYIVYLLKSSYVDDYINSATFGVKMPRVATGTMTSLVLPLPPLAEQKRIVEKIEELLAEVDKLK